MLTSSGRDEVVAQATAVGIDAHLRKPVRQAELYACLMQLLGMAEEAPAKRSPALTSQPTRFTGRVLVAEDNPVNQEVACAMLGQLGCKADVVDDGQQAVKAVTHTHYDLILMDCHMPVLDGFAATVAIRQLQSSGLPPVPIIALTANAIKGFREQCLAVGMDDYLSKPFEQEQLIALLARWIPNCQAANPLPAANPPAISKTVAPSSVADPPLDLEPLNKIRALQRPGAPNLLAKIIGLYLDNSPALLQTLQEAVSHGDAAALKEAAHSLKSSSANLGALPLAALCKELEQQGREQCLKGADKLLAEVKTQYMQVREALLAVTHQETQA